MTSNATIALALFLIASHADAARDESLIRQTRRNQLAHDAAQKAPPAGHAGANEKAPETGAVKG